MIIYNQNLSVCPLTTHLPIKYVARKINKAEIKNVINNEDVFIERIGKSLKKSINNFFDEVEFIF